MKGKLIQTFVIILLLPACATIVSKSSWPFTADSNPAGAHLIVRNKGGVIVFEGRTPAAMLLKSGAGFFSKESYIIEMELPGYEKKRINVECKINGWYFGNILIGGLLGMLIVDPATGAMYRLDSKGVSESLNPSNRTGLVPSLKLLNKAQLPVSLQQYLIRIN